MEYYEVNANESLQKIKDGLVDYIKRGYIIRNGEKIPCQIGYTDFVTLIKPTHIFIWDGITESGTHYYRETIKL